MKNLKHLFTALLLICTTVASAYNFEVDGIYYNIIDATSKTVEVTYYSTYSNKYSGSVVIPENVVYKGVEYSVTSIGGSAFEGCSSLSSIEIPNSVTSIGEYAFTRCSSLSSIEIPNSVTSFGNYAFLFCI